MLGYDQPHRDREYRAVRARASHLPCIEVTAPRLACVDRAETAVRTLLAAAGIAVTDLRIRDLGDIARVELPGPDLQAIRADPGLTRAVGRALDLAGFADATVEFVPFSSGNLNRQ